MGIWWQFGNFVRLRRAFDVLGNLGGNFKGTFKKDFFEIEIIFEQK